MSIHGYPAHSENSARLSFYISPLMERQPYMERTCKVRVTLKIPLS